MKVVLRQGNVGGYTALCADDNDAPIRTILKLSFSHTDADGVNSVRMIMKLDRKQLEALRKVKDPETDPDKIFNAVFPNIPQAVKQGIPAVEAKNFIRAMLAADSIQLSAYRDVIDALIAESKKGDPVTFVDHIPAVFPPSAGRAKP